jgi:histone H3/H4
MTKDAVSLISTVVETIMIDMFSKGNQITLASKRKTLMKRDMDSLMTILNMDDIRDMFRHVNM